MKLFFDGKPALQPRVLMMRAGYGEKITRQGKVSYTRRLAGAEFPRFHAYLDTEDNQFRINLHLDQKGACYTGTSAHSGEYDGEVVEREGARIQTVINNGLLPPDRRSEPSPSQMAGSTPKHDDIEPPLFDSSMTFG